jgi:hypothetical protein
MEQIMAKMRKVLIEPNAGSGTVPYLPLDQLLRQQQQPAPPPSPDASASAGASQ